MNRTTYVLPGINVFKCPMCSRKGNTVFIPVTLKRFNRIMLYGPEKTLGICNACKRQVQITLERPRQPPQDQKKLAQMIRVLKHRFKLG